MSLDNRLRVLGTGHYLPKRIVNNEEFEGRKVFEYDSSGNRVGDGKVLSADFVKNLSGGIERRHYVAEGETSSDMGTYAAINAIDKSGIDLRSLRGIIVGTVTENENFPSAACKIQRNLQNKYGLLMEGEIDIFDVGAACSGGLVALRAAQGLNRINPGNYLIVGAEDVPSMWEDDDQNKFLFGAGAGALVLGPSEDDRGIKATYSTSIVHDGRDRWINRDQKRFGRMANGHGVMKEATPEMIRSAMKVKEMAGWEDADVYIPHQANGKMIDLIERKLSKKGAIVYRTIKDTGNTSAATCLSGLDMAIADGTVKEGSKVVLVSAGSGLVISGAAIQF